ncbi:facilitated trehalose transporter Tret1 isoform X2 [Anoplophora glabripennis]|uniref:facilitated trehalose transporter Tret1 isoform X2 n=1 Tax=Anoplophora glabripennis TaxID=217634 RepID=UPI0008742F82|nr:facilitated trehalose transporter Tret1 isoform X2 [Anoplophora glabripennis]
MVINFGEMFRGTFPQFVAAISGTLFAISDGMTYAWTAPYVPYLLSEKSHIKTTHKEGDWLETTLLIGSFCGIPITIYLVHFVGRKKALLIASSVVLLSWLTMALGNRIEYIFAARFFLGICCNMAIVAAPMYTAEIAEQKIRGLLSGIIYINMHIGCLAVYCVGPYLPFYAAPVIGATVVVLELLIFSTVPESPHFLLYKNKVDEARIALEYLRPNGDVDKELKEICDYIERQKSDKGRIQDLFLIKSSRKATFILAVLNTGQHLCAYTVMLMNLHLILEAAGTIYMDSAVAAILFAAIMLLATIFGSFQSDMFGRRALLIFSSLLTCLCLLALAIYFNLKALGYNVLPVSWVPIVSSMIYAGVFKAGMGIVPIMITGEMFPVKLKSIGVTVADAMYVIGGIVALQIYQILSQKYGLHVPFYFFAAWAFFVLTFTIFYIPETKGKTLDEIQQILNGEKVVEEHSQCDTKI